MPDRSIHLEISPPTTPSSLEVAQVWSHSCHRRRVLPYGLVLSNYIGTSPNGTWHLYVDDDVFNTFTGGISGGWSLSITSTDPPPTTTTNPPGTTPNTPAAKKKCKKKHKRAAAAKKCKKKK